MRRLAVALLLAASAASAQPALPLDHGLDEVGLDGHLASLADESGRLGLEAVRARAGAFRPVRPVLTHDETLPAAVWLRLEALDEKARAEAARARTEAANEALQEALRLTSNLLGFAAYDLRSPLTTVLGYAEMLEAGDATPGEAAAQVRRASTRLLRLIDDLLVTAALEGGDVPLRLEAVDLGPLEAGLAEPFAPLAAA